jgi:hypothetical protein
MPGATLAPQFNVCGTYVNLERNVDPRLDRNATLPPQIMVTLSSAGTTLMTVPATLCAANKWRATFTGAPVGTDFVVTAKIVSGLNSVSHAIETVDVQQNPQLVLPIPCCGDGGKSTELLTYGTSQSVTLAGTYSDPAATSIFGGVQQIVITTQTLTLSGGGTATVYTYSTGALTNFGPGTLTPPNAWTLTLNVDYSTYILVYLQENGTIVARNASQLY